jgi:hypothetical protein
MFVEHCLSLCSVFLQLSPSSFRYLRPPHLPHHLHYIPISHLITTRKHTEQFGAHRLMTWQLPNNFYVLGGNGNTLKNRRQQNLQINKRQPSSRYLLFLIVHYNYRKRFSLLRINTIFSYIYCTIRYNYSFSSAKEKEKQNCEVLWD